MSGKQKEGDNKRRRTLARRARELGRRASEVGVTLGASKQFEHAERAHREGPPPAGKHKWRPETGGPPLPSRREIPSWPWWDPEALGVPSGEEAPVIRYRELIAEVGHRARLGFDAARAATEATVTALARSLPDTDRRRLLAAVPAELHDDYPVDGAPRRGDLAGFLDEVAGVSHHAREQARYHAQAVLSAFAERAPELVGSLAVPAELRELLTPPPHGGGVVGPTGHPAPLTEDELRAALQRLPYWSDDPHGLTRTLALPPGNLQRVLRRLERLKRDTGRGPHIGRRDDGTAVVVVRTTSVGVVTDRDVALAHLVDDAVEEVGAGIAAPPPP